MTDGERSSHCMLDLHDKQPSKWLGASTIKGFPNSETVLGPRRWSFTFRSLAYAQPQQRLRVCRPQYDPDPGTLDPPDSAAGIYSSGGHFGPVLGRFGALGRIGVPINLDLQAGNDKVMRLLRQVRI